MERGRMRGSEGEKRMRGGVKVGDECKVEK